MVTIRPKTTIKMRMSATGETHARTSVKVRDLESIIDEPIERDGTNQGLTPTETLMAALVGARGCPRNRDSAVQVSRGVVQVNGQRGAVR